MSIFFRWRKPKILDLKNKQDGLPTLAYLFKFLDAYDFASEGVSSITENNRSLINASVLGKVFEKINGYKDGSIYTPGFITMYMCRQAIRLAVVQKFKDKFGIDIDTFEDLEIYVGRFYKTENVLEFNRLINSLHLCDPAVGSGHFLVSSLNEIIAIKGKLGILADESGKPFPNFEITIENDELTVFDKSRNEFFKYRITDGKPHSKEANRLQKTLFHEKQTLIENCLFGVDINPNSVKICRLRLWIELLKNAYYKESSGFAELETLPNIDINIKEGNSLISRFALDEDLKQILKQVKHSIEDYRNFVLGYKETRDREKKREFEAKIKQIKDDFKTQMFFFSPERKKLREIRGKLEKIQKFRV
jgi:type II restriction/modification system DNA methylase subunit YeeA